MTGAGPGGGAALVTNTSGTTSGYNAASMAVNAGPVNMTGATSTAGSTGGSFGVFNASIGNAAGFSNGGGTGGAAGAGAGAGAETVAP